jgi:UDP-glucose 4-epimerase
MGNTPPPVSEVSLPSPISPYGASKLCCEGYIRAYSESYDIDAVIFRFANVYGNYSAHKKGAVTKFIKSTLTDNIITIFGDGMATRDFLHVDDLCDGLISGIFSQTKGCEIFHLASGEGTTVLDLAEIILSFKPSSKSKIKFNESRKGEVLQNFADSTKANVQLGFAPKIALVDGLKSTFDWYNELPSSEIIREEYDS